MIIISILVLLFLHQSRAQVGGFLQSDEAAYLASWKTIIGSSYETPLPPDLAQVCVAGSSTYTVASVMTPVYLNGVVHSSQVQAQCGTSSLCVINAGATLIMDGNLNLAALLVYGQVIWNDSTQSSNIQWLCAGYVVMQTNGIFNMTLKDSSHTGFIYIKDNGATHNSTLHVRVFGGINTGPGSFPVIEVTGRPMLRTWSLISAPVAVGATYITLLHDPILMGWQVGDRILLAPTTELSQGTAQWFYIAAMSSIRNTVYLSGNSSNQVFNAQFQQTTGTGVALMAAEVINLSRNIIFTGDNFRHIQCNPGLNGPINMKGCACNPFINRTRCTLGLHTVMSGTGLLKIQYTRVEKCGQRGIMGKYCLHFHYMNRCPNCLFRGNALEFGQQRGITVHETHLSTVEDNVLNDIRGVGLYIEDGNEMYNKIQYNVVICPWPKDSTTLHGCTVPGTDNDQADTTLNQAGVWSLTPINHLIGNRFSNSFNGMFYDCGDVVGGQGGAQGHENTLNTPLARLEGNTFHGHGRFGTYVLYYAPKQNCLPNITKNGWFYPSTKCYAFTSTGLDNGLSVAHLNNVDFQSAFVGGYSVADFQYSSHSAFGNLNNVYWKETKNFHDGCSAHITDSYYSDGNIALPDEAAFIIENTQFVGQSNFESTHHCNVGVTGFLCMPTYVLSNVTWQSSSLNWVQFHQNANNYGGMYVLAPPEIPNLHSKGFFPPNYVSLVSFFWDYVLAFGNDICVSTTMLENAWPGVSAAQLSTFFSNGIFCTLPVRSLKFYTTDLTLETAYNMTLEVYDGATLLTTFQIPYHQIGSDGSTNPPKQGYAFPVIINTQYEYRVYMNGPNPNIPFSWVIEFSDPVFGNRWTPDTIILTVQGRSCNKKLVTSQHDRRWVYGDFNQYLYPESYGRGACNSTNPDMPKIACPSVVAPISLDRCSGKCSQPCQNGFCDCGSNQCVCNAGYYGPDCSQSVCAGTTCTHGRCVATYLGGTIPVTYGSCVCDVGWSGPTCDYNPCQGQTCSGNGVCTAVGDSDWRCQCKPNYSGRTCENSCVGFGCGANFYPFGCANGGTNERVCLLGGGCQYFNTYTPVESSFQCCYQNCDTCAMVTCPLASNDCHIAGSCQNDGSCSAETLRPDFSPCNSLPYGICISGVCNSTSLTPLWAVSPQFDIPPAVAPLFIPSATPVTLRPVTQKPSQKPTISPTISPAPSNVPIVLSTVPGLCPDLKTYCAGCQFCPGGIMCNECSSAPSINPSIVPSLTPSIIPSIVPSISPSAVPHVTPSINAVSTKPPTTPPIALSAPIVISTVPGLCPDLKTYCAGCQFCPGVGMLCNLCSSAPSINPSIVPSLTPSIIPSIVPSISPSAVPHVTPSINAVSTKPPTTTPIALSAPIVISTVPGLCPDLKTHCTGCQFCPGVGMLCNLCSSAPSINPLTVNNAVKESSSIDSIMPGPIFFIVLAITVASIIMIGFIIFRLRYLRHSKHMSEFGKITALDHLSTYDSGKLSPNDTDNSFYYASSVRNSATKREELYTYGNNLDIANISADTPTVNRRSISLAPLDTSDTNLRIRKRSEDAVEIERRGKTPSSKSRKSSFHIPINELVPVTSQESSLDTSPRLSNQNSSVRTAGFRGGSTSTRNSIKATSSQSTSVQITSPRASITPRESTIEEDEDPVMSHRKRVEAVFKISDPKKDT